jgi:hypothetical protein
VSRIKKKQYGTSNISLDPTATLPVRADASAPYTDRTVPGGAAGQLCVEAVEKVVLERFVGYTGAITAGRG